MSAVTGRSSEHIDTVDTSTDSSGSKISAAASKLKAQSREPIAILSLTAIARAEQAISAPLLSPIGSCSSSGIPSTASAIAQKAGKMFAQQLTSMRQGRAGDIASKHSLSSEQRRVEGLAAFRQAKDRLDEKRFTPWHERLRSSVAGTKRM